MQDSKPRRTVKNRHDRRTLVKVFVVRPPRLERAAGHVQPLGRLALGDPLGVQRTISCTAVSALNSAPSVGYDHDCHGAFLGLSLPQAPSPTEASPM